VSNSLLCRELVLSSLSAIRCGNGVTAGLTSQAGLLG